VASPSRSDIKVATDRPAGFPAANFGIAGGVSSQGQILAEVRFNPPRLGEGLAPLGVGELFIAEGDVLIADRDFKRQDIRKLYPRASVEFADPSMRDLALRVDLSAPVAVGDVLVSSLPIIQGQISVINSAARARTVTLMFRFVAERRAGHPPELEPAGSIAFYHDGAVGIGMSGPDVEAEAQGKVWGLTRAVRVPAKSSVQVRLAVATFDEDGYYQPHYGDLPALVAGVDRRWDSLRRATLDFAGALPRIGDPEIDYYLPWYTSAAVMMTKLTRSGDALTMGYLELNQRDSFWSSWVHLVYWPQLERLMIEESRAHQAENGKIPTTILPTIERKDDLDINAYFILRIARYWEWTRDRNFLDECWPAVRAALDYLDSRDKDHDGLPEQKSFWADWKDVEGMDGRKLAPHFTLLYLACLARTAEMADALKKPRLAGHYRRQLREAKERANRPVSRRGLWADTHYVNVWRDRRQDARVLEDQVVGPLFGVVDEDRSLSIFQALIPNETPWGVRETFPYYDHFGEPGVYHNGGVWVYWQAVDAFARYRCGYPEEGDRLLRKVGQWDLVRNDEYLPHEYLHGETGQGAGKEIQAWDAAYFAAVLFGALGVSRVSDNVIEVMPRLSLDRSFETTLILPEGRLRIVCRDGRAAVEQHLKGGPRSLRFGILLAGDGDADLEIGRCRWTVVEASLSRRVVRVGPPPGKALAPVGQGRP
jgi:hypothetical protein